jgi:hypothetical protein
MPTRFEYERHFTSWVWLLPSCRHLLHVLCMRLDKDQFAILPRFQPSLGELTRLMGCDRKTTIRRIRRTEYAGWLEVTRPSKHDAQAKHARSAYVLRYPAGFFPQPELVARYDQPGGTVPAELVAPVGRAGGAAPLKSSQSSASSSSRAEEEGSLEELVTSHVKDRTGRTITPAQAVRIRDQLLSRAGGTLHSPRAWMARVLERTTLVELVALTESPRATPAPPAISSLLDSNGKFLRKDL